MLQLVQSEYDIFLNFNLINGIMISTGALSGGYLLSYMPAVCGNSIYTLLLLSALLRLVVTLFFGKRLKENENIFSIIIIAHSVFLKI